MEVRTSLKYLRISPRKVRLVANLIKGLTVKEAEAHLNHLSKRSSKSLLKLLKSSIADAEHNFHLDKNNLYIKIIRVDEGPAFKRSRARARGAAYPIRKRTSHIFLTLEETKEKKDEIKEKIKKDEEVKGIIKKEDKRKEAKQKMKQPRYKKQVIEKEEKILSRSAQKQKIFRRKAI